MSRVGFVFVPRAVRYRVNGNRIRLYFFPRIRVRNKMNQFRNTAANELDFAFPVSCSLPVGTVFIFIC